GVGAVAAWTDARPEQPLDTRVLALLRFGGGLEAVLVAARAFGRPDNDLVVHGPEGRLTPRDTIWEDLGGSLELATESGLERWDFADAAPGLRLYADQVERFGRAILGEAGRARAARTAWPRRWSARPSGARPRRGGR